MVQKRAVFLLVLLLVLPISAVADSSNIELMPAERYVAYPGQTVEQHIDVTYTGLDSTTLKLDLGTQFLSSISGNGQELVFDNGETKRFLWTISLPQATPYGMDSINITIVDLADQSSQATDVDLKITTPSIVYFGNTQSSTFVVDPGIRTNVATNVTSNATLADNLSFSIQTESSWNWGWNMAEMDGSTSQLLLGPDTMEFVRIWVDVPEVIDGAPLANQGPRFRLIGTSGLDGVSIAWDFTLEVSIFRNATIDAVQSNVVVDPDGNTRVDVTVRNTGNTPDTLAMTLSNLAVNGIASNEADSDRISSVGWTAALFNAFEDVFLMPNETRTVEIGVQAPAITSGTISVDLIIHPTNFPFRTVRETAIVNISWDRGFEHSLVPVDCTYLQPSATCSASVNLENLGNFDDAVTVELTSSASFVTDVFVGDSTFQLARYGEGTFEAIEFMINENATAYQQGTVEFDLNLRNGETFATYSIDVVVGPNVAWTFLDGVSEVDSRDVVSFAVQLRNDGNLEDGLIVQLQSSHSTDMGFAPPEGAIIDSDSIQPRTFEIGNLPRDSNFTLRGTAALPTDQASNGTLVLDIVVRSIFDPETEFSYTIEKEFLGKQWRADTKDNSYSFSEFVDDITLLAKGWWLVILSVTISAVILNKAVRDRIQRNEQDELLRQINKKPEEKEEDWMEKFNRPSNKQPVIAESPQMDSDSFKRAFQSQSNPSAPALEPMPESLRSAATTVLDHHDITSQRSTMDQIASDIVQHGVSKPHRDNEHLEPSAAISERTVRHENPDLTQTPETSPNVPLPTKEPVEDDFDL
ncbi:MAG: Uncharacterised protein [Candidatus Poseidoniaceae archaeon]|nr:MAG: Uncharacterised protein [Candidatus Poseidoniaceae archaeon]